MTLQDRVDDFLKEQQGTAGFEQKLENFIERLLVEDRNETLEEVKRVMKKHTGKKREKWTGSLFQLWDAYKAMHEEIYNLK